MPNPIKIDVVDLEEASGIQRRFVELTQRLGQVEFAKRALNKERLDVETQFDELDQREEKFIKELTAKYGVGSLSLSTGEFMPAEG